MWWAGLGHQSRRLPPGIAINPTTCFTLLGAPIGGVAFCEQKTVAQHVDTARPLLDAIAELPEPQTGLLLLRHCASFCKVVYATRVTPSTCLGSAMETFDTAVRHCLEAVCTGPLSAEAWLQASLPTTAASRSRDVPEEAIRQMVREIQQLQPANPPDNLFMQCLGRPQRDQAPPQNVELTRRALEEWERTICENKAMAILEQIQEGRPALFQRDGGAMLIAIVLDRPLQEAQELVDQPHLFLQEIQQVLDDKKSHPILERMLRMIQGDTAKQEASSSMERPSHTEYMDDTQYQ